MNFWTTYMKGLKRDLPKMSGFSFLLGVLLCISFYDSNSSPQQSLLYILHGSIISFVLWWGNSLLVEYLNYKLSWFDQANLRVILGIFGSLIYTILAFILLQLILMPTFHDYPIQSVLANFTIRNLYMPVIITALITLIIHLVAFFNEWRKAELEKEALKREHLASQFETLKSQVNPHFLFNSLNALSTLVYKDQDLAAQFIQQLSKVYRHVLDTQNKEVISIATELKALEAYIFLVKIRFGDNLNINLDLPESNNYKIAPLALQMLVENAIKHNIVSKSKPLTIDIFIKNEMITVKNNLQIKNSVAESSGIGLANIQARYNYIAKKEVVIQQTATEFSVHIPLLSFE